MFAIWIALIFIVVVTQFEASRAELVHEREHATEVVFDGHSNSIESPISASNRDDSVGDNGPSNASSSLQRLETVLSTQQELPPMFVLNLDRSKARWEVAHNQMQAAGLSVERLPAVDGRALARDELLKESTRLATFLQPRGVIGCYLSHKKFWQLVVDRGYSRAIIFEDDVRLVDDFKQKLVKNLDALAQTNEQFDVIMLGAIGRVHPEGKDGIGVRIFTAYMGGTRPLKRISDSLVQPRKPAGTHAYMVSQEGARKLLSLCSKATFHVDLDAWRHPSLVIRMFDPMLVYQTFDASSLHDLQERTFDGKIYTFRRMVNNKLEKSDKFRKLENWAVEPYTLQPWSHVFNEPLLQLGPNGMLLTVKRHFFIITGGIGLGLVSYWSGQKNVAKRVAAGVAFFFISVRSTIWILMNWK